mgnify:CR=1 FL=1
MAARGLNITAGDAYLHIYDAALVADVTIGTTVPTWVVQADANDPSVNDGLPKAGLVFDLGIVVASLNAITGTTAATQHVRIAIQ